MSLWKREILIKTSNKDKRHFKKLRKSKTERGNRRKKPKSQKLLKKVSQVPRNRQRSSWSTKLTRKESLLFHCSTFTHILWCKESQNSNHSKKERREKPIWLTCSSKSRSNCSKRAETVSSKSMPLISVGWSCISWKSLRYTTTIFSMKQSIMILSWLDQRASSQIN